MGIMNFIKGMMSNRDASKQRFKEIQEEQRIQKIVEERTKTANERELERYYEEERQRKINEELEKIRKVKTRQAWTANDFIGQKTTILKDENPILKQKNIFKGSKIKKQRCMYFK